LFRADAGEFASDASQGTSRTLSPSFGTAAGGLGRHSRGTDSDCRYLRDEFRAHAELKWRYGYFLVIAVIAAICSSLYWRFHRNGWV
jgi:hypothetical protein